MRAAVEGDGLRRPSLRRGAFLHVQTHISTKSDGRRTAAEGGSEREGKLQMNRFSRRPLFLMTIPAYRPRLPRPRRPASPEDELRPTRKIW